MRTYKNTLTAIAILSAVGLTAPRPAMADAGEAALGVFGGLLLGNMLDRGRPQPSAPGRVIYVPRQPPATPYSEPRSNADVPVEQRLRKLQELRDQGLITDAEHAAARREILNSL